MFMHDSLHTYDHALQEFQSVLPYMNKEVSVLMCDNMETGAGQAFSEILGTLGKTGYCYRNFAGVRLP